MPAEDGARPSPWHCVMSAHVGLGCVQTSVAMCIKAVADNHLEPCAMHLIFATVLTASSTAGKLLLSDGGWKVLLEIAMASPRINWLASCVCRLLPCSKPHFERRKGGFFSTGAHAVEPAVSARVRRHDEHQEVPEKDGQEGLHQEADHDVRGNM